MDRTIERVRAVLRFISPDHITPMGVRMVDKVLDEEENMKNVRIQVATHVEDLEGLPVGARILTRQYLVLELDQIEADTERKDAGKTYWIQPGTLQPWAAARADWLPAYILPASSE